MSYEGLIRYVSPGNTYYEYANYLSELPLSHRKYEKVWVFDGTDWVDIHDDVNLPQILTQEEGHREDAEWVVDTPAVISKLKVNSTNDSTGIGAKAALPIIIIIGLMYLIYSVIKGR